MRSVMPAVQYIVNQLSEADHGDVGGYACEVLAAALSWERDNKEFLPLVLHHTALVAVLEYATAGKLRSRLTALEVLALLCNGHYGRKEMAINVNCIDTFSRILQDGSCNRKARQTVAKGLSGFCSDPLTSEVILNHSGRPLEIASFVMSDSAEDGVVRHAAASVVYEVVKNASQTYLLYLLSDGAFCKRFAALSLLHLRQTVDHSLREWLSCLHVFIQLGESWRIQHSSQGNFVVKNLLDVQSDFVGRLEEIKNLVFGLDLELRSQIGRMISLYFV